MVLAIYPSHPTALAMPNAEQMSLPSKSWTNSFIPSTSLFLWHMPCWTWICTIKHLFPLKWEYTKSVGGNLTIRSLSIEVLDQAGLILECFRYPLQVLRELIRPYHLTMKLMGKALQQSSQESFQMSSVIFPAARWMGSHEAFIWVYGLSKIWLLWRQLL